MSIVSRAMADWRECRAEYDLVLFAAYERAERETGGAVLNARGKTAGVDPVSLFMGNRARAYAYASDELVEHWRKWPRMTFERFEAEWIRQNDGREY